MAITTLSWTIYESKVKFKSGIEQTDGISLVFQFQRYTQGNDTNDKFTK